jgi:hypothetical protein
MIHDLQVEREAIRGRMVGRTITRVYPADVGVMEKGEEMTIWVLSPPFYAFRNPDILPSVKDENHAFLRPFRRFLEDGNPEIGKVWFLSLCVSLTDFVRTLGSVVLTTGPTRRKCDGAWLGNRRLLFFPGLGLAREVSIGKDGRKVVRTLLDHFTVEEREDGRLESHTTYLETTESRKKPQLAEKRKLGMWDEDAHHIVTLCLGSPKKLDRSGNVYGSFKVPNRARSPENILRESLADRHPIIQLPEADELKPGTFLRVDMLLARSPLKDKEYPKPFINGKSFKKGPETIPGSMERLIPIPLKKDVSLLLIVRTARGEPLHDIVWFRR